MKILVFLHGTTIMHKDAEGKSRKERVKQSTKRIPSVLDYANYVPIGNAAEKLVKWRSQRAHIIYFSSRKNVNDVKKDKAVLEKYKFPTGKIVFRNNNLKYKDIVKRIIPDVLIEDDCESIGGRNEMAITKVSPKIRKKIKSIVVKEFVGIDKLPDDIAEL